MLWKIDLNLRKMEFKLRSSDSKFVFLLMSLGIELGFFSLFESRNVEQFYELLIQYLYFGISKVMVFVKNRC